MPKNNLFIWSKKRTITIPFKNIKKLDLFTSSYKDKYELIKVLNDIFNLEISNINEFNCNIQYFENQNDTHEKYLPVVYQNNNFDIQDVEKKYALYLSKDPSRILTEDNGITNVIDNYLRKCHRSNLLITDIPYIVHIFIKDSYKRTRDIYFKLINENYKIKINPVPELPRISRTNLLDYLMKDDYLEYLQETSSRSNDERNRAIDTISQYDLDFLMHNVDNPKFSLFDGLGSEKAIDTESEMYSLAELSGYSINDLMKLVEEYQIEYKRRIKK